jgi:hypothetical protein
MKIDYLLAYDKNILLEFSVRVPFLSFTTLSEKNINLS